MKTWTAANVKNRFAEVLNHVENGGEITVTFGRAKKKVAVIVPYKKYFPPKPRRLGILEGKAKYSFSKNFKVGEAEFFAL